MFYHSHCFTKPFIVLQCHSVFHADHPPHTTFLISAHCKVGDKISGSSRLICGKKKEGKVKKASRQQGKLCACYWRLFFRWEEKVIFRNVTGLQTIYVRLLHHRDTDLWVGEENGINLPLEGLTCVARENTCKTSQQLNKNKHKGLLERENKSSLSLPIDSARAFRTRVYK